MSVPSSHRPSVSPFDAMARHWLVVLVVVAVGVLCGVGAGFVVPATHRAEARLAVTPDGNSAYTIPGFPLAARELAADYARWVQNTGEGETAGTDADVTASPIPDSGVVRIEAEAATPEQAVTGAQQVADQLEATVQAAQQEHDPDAAYERFAEIAPQVAQAQGRVDAAESAYGAAVGGEAPSSQVRAAADELAAARTELAEIQLQQSAAGERYRRLYSDTMGITQLQVISPATSAGDNRSALVQRGAVLGLGIGLLLALILAFLRERRAAKERIAGTGGSEPGATTGKVADRSAGSHRWGRRRAHAAAGGQP